MKKIPVWLWVLIVLVVAAAATVFASSGSNETPATPVVEVPATTPAEPAAETPAEKPAESPKETEAPAEAEAEPKKPVEPKVLARVEGKDITEQDVITLAQSMGQQGIALYMNPEGRQSLLNELVSRRLLALEAEKEKLDESEEFKTAMENVRAQFLMQLAAREAVKDVQPVTVEDARKYYDENLERFTQPERIHARHILLSDDVASQENIAKVQADLKNGIAFDEIARVMSICPSAPQGGDLGEFTRGQMVPEFEEAAFALKEPGDISEPVKTQFGWHIIKLEGRTPAAPVPFEQIQAQLIQELQSQCNTETLVARVDELRKNYNVELIEPELEHSPDPTAEAEKADAGDEKKD